MDFRSRGMQHPTTPSSASSTSSKFRGRNLGKWLDKGPAAILLGVSIVITALTAMLMLSGDAASKAIHKDDYQAVFLTNGQVYFGNIKQINDRSLNLRNIFYLQSSSAETGAGADKAPSNVSLVKLGCELHGPYDQMIINNDQILFWENLKDSSRIVTGIEQIIKDTPKNQACSTTSNSTQQATPGTQQPATTTPPASNTPAR